MQSTLAAGIMDKDRGGMDMLTREDLAAIGAMMDEKLETVKAEFSELMDERLETGLKPIRQDITEMKADIVGMKADIVGMKTDIEEMKGEILTLKDRTTKLELTMEHQVDRAVGLVLDGHESLRQMIEGRLVTKDEREQDRIRICTLEGVTKLHTTQIAELKKKIV